MNCSYKSSPSLIQCEKCGVLSQQSRMIECRDDNGALVPATECLTDTKPISTQACTTPCPTEQPCTDNWAGCNSLAASQCSQALWRGYCCNSCSKY